MSSKKRSAKSSDWTSTFVFAGISLLLVAVAIVVWWRSGREYPEVSSAKSLYLMRALYTACSSKNADRLSAVERGVESAKEEGSMSEAEYLAFVSIFARARDGAWNSAATESYRFARDQVR